MTTQTDTDTRTWVVTGLHTCDVHRCCQDAAIIADDGNHDRFCTDHTDEAVAVALTCPVFGGWFRIVGSAYHHPARLMLTVHPL